LVPEALSGRIIQKLQQYGTFRRNALNVKVGPRQYVPKIGSDVVVYAPGEGKVITQSDVLAKMIKLEPIKMACLTVISSELDEDSLVGMGELIGLSITRALAQKEDAIGFSGTGTEDDFGLCGIVGAFQKLGDNPAAIAGLQVASGNAYSEITLGDFEALIGRLEPAADAGAKWYVHKRFFFSVMHRLASATGAADMFAILSSQKARHFMGYPVEFVHSMPHTEANSQVCAILGDLNLGAYLGETRSLEVARSEHAYFESDKIGFRATERIDVSAFGTGTADSPESIVALVTAAA